jgi:hypothetical protein
MEVRVVRTVEVKPESIRDFLRLSLDVAKYVSSKINITPDVYWWRHGSNGEADFAIFTDFPSLAIYEKEFLEGLLFDKVYLDLVETGGRMIHREPQDELLVRMDRNDFFMNLKNPGATPQPKVRAAQGARPRYRRLRGFYSAPNKLRDVMMHSFDVFDRFEALTGVTPEIYCTRFTYRSGIGSVRQFFDYGDPPPGSDPFFLAHNQEFNRVLPGATDKPPVDELYVLVTEDHANFGLAA